MPAVAERCFTIASTDYTMLVLLPAVMAAIEREAPGVDLRVVGYDKGDVPDLIDRGSAWLRAKISTAALATSQRTL